MGIPKEYADHSFEKVQDAVKHPADFMTLQEISKLLGAKV